MTGQNKADGASDMRELAVKNIDQARAAYTQLLDAARQAQEMWKKLIPSNPVLQGLGDVQDRALTFAQQNLDAGFAMASELTKATDLADALQIQSRHAQLQMHAYSLQAQELAKLVSAAAQKGK